MRYTRDQLIEMERKLLNNEYNESIDDEIMEILKTSTGDPKISDYLFYSDPPLSPEDAVDLALKSGMSSGRGLCPSIQNPRKLFSR